MKTLTEKILSRASGTDVSPGDVIEVEVDLVAFHDLTGYHVIEVMDKVGARKVSKPENLVIAFDHLVPPPDVKSAEIQQAVRSFARELKLPNFHDVGYGILHQVLVERYVMPGQVVVVADSHASTSGALGAFAQGMGASDVAAIVMTGRTWLTVPQPFKLVLDGEPRQWITGKEVSLELLRVFKADYFVGTSIEVFVNEPSKFPMDYRLTVANMGIEMNADSLIFIPDEVTRSYIESMRNVKLSKVEKPDPGAKYVDEYTLQLNNVDFLVAAPSSVDNVKSVRELSNVEVDMVFIGSCTNGRLSDLEIAAKIMRGKKVKTRCIVIPASWSVFKKALELGYIQTLVEAGCVVTYGTCGPCIGGHFGVAGPNEVVVSTSNRNFVGRMGSPQSKVYLSGPAVAAATAIAGRIAEPSEVL
ncbi:MAG: 3-isopropylmalate dehydratase large subunit [Candidatus Nezhaarchaeota archaeon]|nr:3-isopropylmalate dehydratase large subunit [Candidatus Nezhaarchaeota archaeon]